MNIAVRRMFNMNITTHNEDVIVQAEWCNIKLKIIITVERHVPFRVNRAAPWPVTPLRERPRQPEVSRVPRSSARAQPNPQGCVIEMPNHYIT